MDSSSLIIDLFLQATKILLSLPRNERRDLDEVEVVFVDNINGNLKPRRTCGFLEVITAIADKGKPVGLILEQWGSSSQMRVMPFTGIALGEEQALMSAFAEAQDEAHEFEDE